MQPYLIIFEACLEERRLNTISLLMHKIRIGWMQYRHGANIEIQDYRSKNNLLFIKQSFDVKRMSKISSKPKVCVLKLSTKFVFLKRQFDQINVTVD